MTVSRTRNVLNADYQGVFDILLHPRVPPLVRSQPEIESIALWHEEESAEEVQTRAQLHLRDSASLRTEKPADVVMIDIEQPSSVVNYPPPDIVAPRDINVIAMAPPLSPLQPFPSASDNIVFTASGNKEKEFEIVVNQPADIGNSSSTLLQPVNTIVSPDPIPALAMIPKPTIPLFANDDTEDVEMPSIDLESDSEDE